MSIPKQAEEIRNDRQAVAPYNFVPLPDSLRLAAKPPPSGFYDRNLFTGTITCKMTNSTPIYVRAAQTLNEFNAAQVSKQPFYYGDKVIIPGSSIRGMLRTLVEVVSQSRLAPVTEKQLFYRSVENTSMGIAYRERMKDNVRAGYYHEDKSEAWITPTIACRVSRDELLDKFSVPSLYVNEKPASPKRTPRLDVQHKRVFIKLPEKSEENLTRFYPVDSIEPDKVDGLEEGIVVITGDMQNKKNEFVFLKRAIGPRIKLKDEDVYLFEDRDQITQYQKFAFKSGRRGQGTLKDGAPVFYLVDENSKVIGFGRAYMFRLPYKLSPAEMLPDELQGNPEQYDLAEALFGYVPADNRGGRKAVATRLFIGDATMRGKADEALMPEMRFKILSSPKPTSFQHYLTQEDPDDPDKLRHYDSPKNKTTLRGHKFYWHKGLVALADFQADEKSIREHDTQYSPPVRPVKEEQLFEFEIRFENLRPEELGALLWVLDKAKDKQYRLKLGMGKPYGLGSVAIFATTKLEDRFKRYQKLALGDRWFVQEDNESEKKCDDARDAFARWILQSKDAAAKQVDEQERIQELLMMLSWKEAPSKNDTRYMELKEYVGQQGRYRTKRPVLPAPHVVFGGWLKSSVPPDDNKTIPSNYERGVVKEFGLGPNQSYGFITRSNGADLFVHRNALQPELTSLKPGQKVIFKIGKGPKGPQAQDVRLEE